VSCFAFDSPGSLWSSPVFTTKAQLQPGSARGSFRLGTDADAADDEELALKKSKSRHAKNTTPSGSYGAKQSTYFVDENDRPS